jgi:hypothetical protein
VPTFTGTFCSNINGNFHFNAAAYFRADNSPYPHVNAYCYAQAHCCARGAAG